MAEAPEHPEAQVTDAQLLARHVEGDPESFGTLFARHRDRLWAVAIRTLGNPDTAADALQEAMIAAFRRADTFRGDAAVTSWLHRIVVNACLDQVRRQQVRAADALPDDLDQGIEVPAPAEADPVDRIAERDAVLVALRTLPTAQRAAVVLVDMEGYPVSEVAEMLGCAPGTVKSRCARARARLLPLLSSVRNPDARTDVSSVDAPEPAPGGDLT